MRLSCFGVCLTASLMGSSNLDLMTSLNLFSALVVCQTQGISGLPFKTGFIIRFLFALSSSKVENIDLV